MINNVHEALWAAAHHYVVGTVWQATLWYVRIRTASKLLQRASSRIMRNGLGDEWWAYQKTAAYKANGDTIMQHFIHANP
jgi:hypothetical protein